MAYERSHSRTSSTGLASSISCLDGVPFKIGLKFKPPPRFLWPEEIKERKRCAALDDEYLFETEEAVLAWAKAREEKKEQVRLETVSKVTEAVDNYDSGDSSNTDDTNNLCLTNTPSLNQNQSKSTHSKATRSGSQPDHNSSQIWPQPVAASMSADILTPVPITSSKVDPPDADSHVVNLDLALFEKQEDLFDNIDRQMINEMEELKTVLQHPSGDVNLSNSNNNHSVVVDKQDVVEPATSVSCNSEENREQCNGLTDSDCDNKRFSPPIPVKPVPAVRKSKLQANVVPEGDYVELRKDCNSDVVFFNVSGYKDEVDGLGTPEVSLNKHAIANSDEPGEKLVVDIKRGSMPGGKKMVRHSSSGDIDGHRTSDIIGGNLPPVMANSSVFKPVLPPIHTAPPKPARPAPPPPKPAKVNPKPSVPQKDNLVHFLPPRKHSEPALSSGLTQNCVSVSDDSIVPPSQLSQLSSVPASNVVSNKYSRYSEVFINSETDSEHCDRDGSSPLRSTSSNPDLVHSSPSRRVNSVSPPPRPSSQQLWNPYKPLPSPIAVSRESSCSDFTSPSEFDPYTALSPKEQEFVNNLAAMGFSRPLVGRAVAKLGTNEKEVLDHLDDVDKLSEKGFNPILSETALQLFNNNSKKAEEYLKLFAQFEELGFGADRIKDALMKENLDRDKALDVLTSC